MGRERRHGQVETYGNWYHFHKPGDEAEANRWFRHYLAQYNGQRHRSEPHSRLEDWLANLPAEGVREVCAWERFCAFAREPERRQVGGDAQVSVAGTLYEVDADLAGETVLLWWGLFDQDLYVEHGDARYGPYHPVGGPVPLHHYRQHKKGKREKRADRVAVLAGALQVPRAVLEGHPALAAASAGPLPFPRCRGGPLPILTRIASSPTRTGSPPSSRSRRRSECRSPG